MFALLEAGRVFACFPKARMLESRFFTHCACLRELLGVFVSPVVLFGCVLVLFFQGPGYSQCEPKAYDSTLPCGRLCCHTGCPTLLGLTCGLTAASRLVGGRTPQGPHWLCSRGASPNAKQTRPLYEHLAPTYLFRPRPCLKAAALAKVQPRRPAA